MSKSAFARIQAAGMRITRWLTDHPRDRACPVQAELRDAYNEAAGLVMDYAPAADLHAAADRMETALARATGTAAPVPHRGDDVDLDPEPGPRPDATVTDLTEHRRRRDTDLDAAVRRHPAGRRRPRGDEQ